MKGNWAVGPQTRGFKNYFVMILPSYSHLLVKSKNLMEARHEKIDHHLVCFSI